MLTTLDIGEESNSLAAAGDFTTLLLGEEEDPKTTEAIGEEDGPTTLRVGEEDGSASSGGVLDPFGAF